MKGGEKKGECTSYGNVYVELPFSEQIILKMNAMGKKKGVGYKYLSLAHEWGVNINL